MILEEILGDDELTRLRQASLSRGLREMQTGAHISTRTL
jgi:hypothetical protein